MGKSILGVLASCVLYTAMLMVGTSSEVWRSHGTEASKPEHIHAGISHTLTWTQMCIFFFAVGVKLLHIVSDPGFLVIKRLLEITLLLHKLSIMAICSKKKTRHNGDQAAENVHTCGYELYLVPFTHATSWIHHENQIRKLENKAYTYAFLKY